ncbi:MAG: TetR family transcriptional regulator [Thermodesulfovibrionales bacterium]
MNSPDDKTTRQKLLEAGESLFLKRGYEGVSVRELSEKAGVNSALINYHFQGKRNLYREVFRKRLAEIGAKRMAALEEAVGEGGTPDLARVIRAYVSGFLGEMLSSRDMERLLDIVSREMSHSGIATDIMVKEIAAPLHRLLKDAIKRARPHLSDEKASLCIISVTGQMFHFVRAREIIKRITGHGYTKEFVDEVVEHITEFSLRGIGQEEGKA